MQWRFGVIALSGPLVFGATLVAEANSVSTREIMACVHASNQKNDGQDPRPKRRNARGGRLARSYGSSKGREGGRWV